MERAPNWESILVAVRDPGERKQIAIRKAARIALRTGARITLFHSFSVPLPMPETMPADARAVLRAVTKARRAQLRGLARPLRAAGIKVRCEAVWDFPPAHSIVRRVLESKPDLVVAESHRHSRIARWFLANSDWELIRECPCPVWFVKHERFAKRPLILTAIDPTHARAKPSGLDDRLLSAAKAVTSQLGGRIALVHAGDTTRSLQAVTVEAIDRLAKRQGVPPPGQVVRAGVPAEVIMETVAELHADLLVMGAVSRSGFGLSHIGGTAEAVIDGVACDLLIIKPRQFKTAVGRKRPKLPAIKK